MGIGLVGGERPRKIQFVGQASEVVARGIEKFVVGDEGSGDSPGRGFDCQVMVKPERRALFRRKTVPVGQGSRDLIGVPVNDDPTGFDPAIP